MKILHLTLKKKWFNLIKDHVKIEEYREIKPYWNKRLNGSHTHILFVNGYGKDRPRILIELKEIMTGLGLPLWGAPEKKTVYILRLGKIIDTAENGWQKMKGEEQ